MKFPYGISDFYDITTNGYYYCDRTGMIPLLEQAKSQLFIRPRRFGKSLLLSMLENYYDVSKKDDFEKIFGKLGIGKNPTKLRNSYFILRWDFSCVDPSGSADDIKKSFFDHINACIEGFYALYKFKGFDLPEINIRYDNALYSIKSLIDSIQQTPYPIYLLIDEYDNFANSVMMGTQTDETRYNALVHDEGPLRTLFKTIKSLTAGTMFDRVFITGVSPVVMSDITSGYNIAKNIYFKPEYNDLCGITEDEIKSTLKLIVNHCGLKKDKLTEALELMRTYYNGYRFSFEKNESVYNPTLCIYFLEQFEQSCKYPRKMLDSNLAVDASKLEYISGIPGGRKLLVDLIERDQSVSITDIGDRFGISEMLSDKSKDRVFLSSFLYYFGVLTIASETDDIKVNLKVPNLVMQSLYVERAQKMLFPEPENRDEGKWAAEKVYQKGDIKPLCQFIEKSYFKTFKNRDYRWANELTLKTVFLTLLYNDIVFIMDSEKEITRRYADLTMIVRPDKRHATVYDVLIEFKYVSLKDAGISGSQAEKLSEKELYELPLIQQELSNGNKQVSEYGKKLEQQYKNLRLVKFVVVSLGFERVCYQKVE